MQVSWVINIGLSLVAIERTGAFSKLVYTKRMLPKLYSILHQKESFENSCISSNSDIYHEGAYGTLNVSSLSNLLDLHNSPCINAENRQQDNFSKEDGLQSAEEICAEIVDGDDEAHVRRRQHLPRDAEGHRYARKVEVARAHRGDDGHDDGDVALGHASQHADDEGHAGDDDRNGQRRRLKGRHNLWQHAYDGQDLDEIEDAEHVPQHFFVQCADHHVPHGDKAVCRAQHEKQQERHDSHGHRRVHDMTKDQK